MKSITHEMLAEFEAKHGKVKRKLIKSKPAKVVLTAEQVFAQAWESDPLPGVEMVREHRFHPTRLWRFDFSWPKAKLALELEGMGRHQRFVGFREDAEKYNAALLLGWRVLRFLSADKKNVQVWLREVKLALCGMADT